MSAPIEITYRSVRVALFELTDKDKAKWVTCKEIANHMFPGKAWAKQLGLLRPRLFELVQCGILQSRSREKVGNGRRPVEFRYVEGGLTKPLPKDDEESNPKPKPVMTLVCKHTGEMPKAPLHKTPKTAAQVVPMKRCAVLPCNRMQSVASLRKLLSIAVALSDVVPFSEDAAVIELNMD